MIIAILVVRLSLIYTGSMKIIHSLKLQFIVFFSVFIIALILVSAILGIQQLSRSVEDAFAVQGVYIVERAASLVDGDSFERLAHSLDDDDPFYEETRLKLLDLKQSSGSLYLYTMGPVGGNLQSQTWMYIIDGSLEPDDEDFSFIGDEEDSEEYGDAFFRALRYGTTETARLSYQEGWGWLISVYTPIFNSRGNIVGIVGCDFDGEPLYNSIREVQLQKIIIGVISVILGLGLLLLFLRMIFSRLHHINAILKEISLGEGDLTKRIEVDKDDEIGELSNYFNLTLDKIKNLIVVIKGESGNLHDIGNELASNMQQTAGAVNQINANIQGIKDKVGSQSASVVETHATMVNVSSNIERLGKNVEEQSSSVSKSSAAIEEMLANIQSVTQTLIRNAENVEELIKESEEGRGSIQKVSQDIMQIAKESEGLLEINGVMENIASQTSLLSMNAAIEAAHAGESGKGFAVVAGEIRKLATDSAAQSKTISEVLKRIKIAIDTITASTNAVLDKFGAIEERVKTVSVQETHIRNAMEEQGQGSQTILQAVSKMNDETQKVKEGSDEMLMGSNEVIRESKNLENMSSDISRGMNEMATGADDINRSIILVNELSKKTKEHIETLFEEISMFKVD